MSEQFGWSEWIEHKPGDPCPIPWVQPYDWRYVTGDDDEDCDDDDDEDDEDLDDEDEDDDWK